MNAETQRHLSILACLSGLALAAAFFLVTWQRVHAPDWLPMMIAAIGGFELFVAGHAFWQRRRTLRGGR